MFEEISKDIKIKLWNHQTEALDFAIDHLNRIDSPCLIRMPTGTGKTGVIACLTRLSNKRSSLVITPWINLRTQLTQDIERGFWKKIGIEPNKHEVVEMFPSNAEEILSSSEPKVIICTFAAITSIYFNHNDVYNALANAISLVIVDECHYEPAVNWGKAVKGLITKTILLTATPYRNDLKLFRITNPSQSTHHFNHAKAIENNIIRNVIFEDLDSSTNILSLVTSFKQKWIELKQTNRLPSADPRAIICCSNNDDIEKTVMFLNTSGIKTIGVHERFNNSINPNLKENVPSPQKTDAEIWVHQNKLTEGLDDNRFCCIAFFSRINNDRKLIQQIGRILRTSAQDQNKPAIVLAPSMYSIEQEWKSYLYFETKHDLLEPQHYRKVVELILESQPKVEYFDGRFREKFYPSKLNEETQVVISPSVIVRKANNDFSLEDYIEDCTDTLNIEDTVILGPDINGPCKRTPISALWVYASVKNSRSLQKNSLYEIKLESHCIVYYEGLVFIADSRGIYPTDYVADHTQRVPVDQLTRFIDNTVNPNLVSLSNSIPYDTVPRGIEMRGTNFNNIPPSLTDRMHILRSIRGTSKESGRKYIGVNNGRIRKEISEENRRGFDLEIFINWTKSVANALNSNIESNYLFKRYMPHCDPPEVVIPKIICMDLFDPDIKLTIFDGNECSLKNSSSDFTDALGYNQNKFTSTFELERETEDDFSISINAEYKPLKQRFWFTQSSGPLILVDYENEKEVASKNLAKFLNQNQDIILISLNDGETVYQGGYFYKIDYGYAENILLDLIRIPDNSPQCSTEKGSKEQITLLTQEPTTVFPEESLFRAITDHIADLTFNTEFLICDDMGKESADFIAGNFTEHKLAFIHAKAGKGSKVSASAFHVVVSQAMKNLRYLTMIRDIPGGAKSWNPDNTWSRTNIPILYQFQDGLPTGENLWNKIKTEIINSSSPELYVVLVTTGCCDKNELTIAANKPDRRTPEIAQLFHLIDGLHGNSRQLGVKLIIYDLPYKHD